MSSSAANLWTGMAVLDVPKIRQGQKPKPGQLQANPNTKPARAGS